MEIERKRNLPLLDPEAELLSKEDDEDAFPLDDLHFVLLVADLLLVVVVVVLAVRAVIVVEVVFVVLAVTVCFDIIFLDTLSPVTVVVVVVVSEGEETGEDFLISTVIVVFLLLLVVEVLLLLLLLLSPGHKSIGEGVGSIGVPLFASFDDRMIVVDVTTSSDLSTSKFKLLLLRVVIRFDLNSTAMITFLCN